jgi:hypothetical protein
MTKRGPGRPEIGQVVAVRIPPAMLDCIDAVMSVNAETLGGEWADMPRAAVIRSLLRRALYGDAAGSDPAQLWRERHERFPDAADERREDAARRDAEWDQ